MLLELHSFKYSTTFLEQFFSKNIYFTLSIDASANINLKWMLFSNSRSCTTLWINSWTVIFESVDSRILTSLTFAVMSRCTKWIFAIISFFFSAIGRATVANYSKLTEDLPHPVQLRVDLNKPKKVWQNSFEYISVDRFLINYLASAFSFNNKTVFSSVSCWSSLNFTSSCLLKAGIYSSLKISNIFYTNS